MHGLIGRPPIIPQSEIPEGHSGDWRVEKFTIDPDDWRPGLLGARAPAPGTYTRIWERGTLWMSDTPAEVRDHVTAVNRAQGHCLVHGLGLGMVAQAMALKPGVLSVTVIEKAPDCIALVAPHLHPKVTVIEGDSFTWTPPKKQRYGVVWHDVWPTICPDDRADRTRLMRRYGRRCDWQGHWAAGEVDRAWKEERAFDAQLLAARGGFRL